jgi:hypothetical protein
MQSALLLVVCSLPFVDLEVFQLGGKSFVLPYVTSAVLILPLLRRPGRLAPAFRDATFPLLLGWLLIAGISTALSILRYGGEPFLAWDRAAFQTHNATQFVNVAMMVAQYALFLCAVSTLKGAQLRSLVTAFIVVGTILSVYSLYQIGTVLFGWPLYDPFRTSNLYLKAPTLHPEGYGSWIRFPRAYGTAPEPSMWGGYLVVVIACLLGRSRERVTLAGLAALGLLTAGVVMTFSRSAWLSLLVVGAVWFVATAAGRIPRIAGPVMVVGVIGWTFAPAILVAKNTGLGFGDLSALDRMSANLTGLNVFFDHPLLGAGLGSFRFLIDRYLFAMTGYGEVLFFTVFNYFLLVFVSTGLIGGVVFLAFVGSVLRRAVWAVGHTPAAKKLASLPLGAALAVVAVVMFWLNTPAYNFSYLWFALSTAAVMPRLMAAEDGRSAEATR